MSRRENTTLPKAIHQHVVFPLLPFAMDNFDDFDVLARAVVHPDEDGLFGWSATVIHGEETAWFVGGGCESVEECTAVLQAAIEEWLNAESSEMVNMVVIAGKDPRLSAPNN